MIRNRIQGYLIPHFQYVFGIGVQRDELIGHGGLTHSVLFSPLRTPPQQQQQSQNKREARS